MPTWPDPDPDATTPRRDPDGGDPVIIGVSFDRMVRAREYLLAMSRLRDDGVLDLSDAVIVAKDDDGHVRVTETIDPTPGRTALSGAIWTGLLGLIVGGPIGWLAGMGVGAGVGAGIAKVVDLGLPDDWVGWFEQAVRPGSSTIVILCEFVHVEPLIDEARRFPGAELLYAGLAPDAMTRLRDAFERD